MQDTLESPRVFHGQAPESYGSMTGPAGSARLLGREDAGARLLAVTRPDHSLAPLVLVLRGTHAQAGGVEAPERVFPAEVICPPRPRETGPRSRILRRVTLSVVVLCLLLLGLAALTPGASRAAGENLIRNGNFAIDSDGDGMADHWAFSGDETVKVTWARDRGAAGGHSQRLVCTSLTGRGPASHAMLAQYDTFSLQQGHWYRLTFNAKGQARSGVVSVAIQQTGPWEGLGLNDMFRIRPEWRPQQFLFRAAKDISSNLRLQIWIGEPGTIWLDDVRLTEAEPVNARPRYTEVVPDLGSKNLLPNSSFECGTSGWGSISPGVAWGGSSLSSIFGRIDREAAARHSQSFRIDLDRATAPVLAFDYFQATRVPVLMPLLANRGWISVTPGEQYTFSAYIKSEPAATPCAMVIHQAFGHWLRQDVKATGEWQRVAFTFEPEGDQIYVAIGPDLTQSDLPGCALWVDAVQLEKGPKASEYELRSPMEVGLEWERPGHLFASAGEARAVVTGFNGTDQKQTVQVSAAVTDFFDRAASSPRLGLALPPGRPVRKALNLAVPGKGFYRFRLKSSGAVVIPVSLERFGVVDICTDPDGLFGMNHAYPSAELLLISKQFGLTWYRDWSLKWQEVEPEKGRFTFAETDFQIERVRREGLNVLGLLPFPSSDWSSSAPADAGPSRDMGEHARMAYKPKDLGEFATYVRTTVQHYAGRIRIWEILNEPLYTSYALPQDTGHTLEDYVAILKTAYQAIKQVDPTAFVVGGIAADPETLAQGFIGAGGLDWLDAINLHIYPVLRAPETYLHGLASLNRAMERAGKPKPIYFTEGSYYGDDDLAVEPYHAGDPLLKPLDSELECASYQARFDVILLAHQVKKIIYHSGTHGHLNQPLVEGIFFEWDGAPRKMAISQSVLTALFGLDTECIGSIWEAPHSFAFHSRGRTVAAVWDDQDGRHTLTPRAGARLIDLSGAEVKERRVKLGGTPYCIIIDRQLTLGQAREMLQGWLK